MKIGCQYYFFFARSFGLSFSWLNAPDFSQYELSGPLFICGVILDYPDHEKIN